MRRILCCGRNCDAEMAGVPVRSWPGRVRVAAIGAAVRERTRGLPLTTGVAVAVAVAVASATCMAKIDAQPLSWDEAVTANAAARPLPALWHLLRHTDGPLGLYYAFMHVWMLLARDIGGPPVELWLRLPSALAAIAAVALTVVMASRLYGPLSGLISGLILAVQPLFIFYATDARPYAIVTLLAVAAGLVLLSILEAPTKIRLAGYGLLVLVAIYIQFWMIFVVAAHAIVVLATRRARLRYAITVGLVAIASVPLVHLSSGENREIGWIPAPTVGSTIDFVDRVWGGVVGLVVLWVLVQSVASRLMDRNRVRTPRVGVGTPRVRTLMIAAWAIVPPVALIAVSAWQPVLIPRYALLCVPATAVGIVAVLRHFRRPVAVTLVVTLLAVSAATTLVQQTRAYKYENFRAAADIVIDTDHPGDAIVFAPSSFRIGIHPYLHGDPGDTDPIVPADVALAVSASPYTGSTIGGTEVTAGQLAARVDASSRIYLVGASFATLIDGDSGSGNAPKQDALLGYTPAWSHTYGALTVTLLIHRSANPTPLGGPPLSFGGRQPGVTVDPRRSG